MCNVRCLIKQSYCTCISSLDNLLTSHTTDKIIIEVNDEIHFIYRTTVKKFLVVSINDVQMGTY